MDKETLINLEIERLSKIKCIVCGAYDTIVKPMGVAYLPIKYSDAEIERLQKIPGRVEPPHIRDAVKQTNDLYKDCNLCGHRQRIGPEDIRYFRDNWKGLDEDDKKNMKSKNRITREQLYAMVDKLEQKTEKIVQAEMCPINDPKAYAKPKEEWTMVNEDDTK